LDDYAELTRFYENNGYIFLRDVLNRESIELARGEMFAVMERLGLIAPGAVEPVWTGKPFAGGMEESEVFSGISRRLVEHPDNLLTMEKILGEPACMVPMVQYRTYPPGGPITPPHQDGFYSPGIIDYKPVWIPLIDCPREVGGLTIAIGQHKRGYLHNLAKPTPFPIPAGVIPDDSWATTFFHPGDALIVHPHTPHCSMPNTSNLCRVTLDTRVQSASNPSAVAATVVSVTPNSITADCERVGRFTLRVDQDTFIRPVDPGRREPFERFADVTRPGMRLVVVMDGDYAVMLRRASEG
jgi:ectoine hydroxylase-related dioxygenase (phytanoyl-CoA dioxygenase family)